MHNIFSVFIVDLDKGGVIQAWRGGIMVLLAQPASNEPVVVVKVRRPEGPLLHIGPLKPGTGDESGSPKAVP